MGKGRRSHLSSVLIKQSEKPKGAGKKLRGQGRIPKSAAKALSVTSIGATCLFKREKKRQQAESAKRQAAHKKEFTGQKNASKRMTRRQRESAKDQLYPEGKNLLLVGEGDFSFAAALARLRGHGGGMVATALDTLEQVNKKYPGAKNNLAVCEEQGVVVVHGVDATDLQECEAVSGSASEIDAIIFNFPHTGCGIRDKARNVARHQQLLRDFFASARELITSEGEIHVSLKKGEPYDSWNLSGMAKDASLVVKTSFPFSADMFPGYAHCRTSGVEGDTGDNAIINKYGARIWVLALPDTNYRKTVSEAAPRFRHDLDDAESGEDGESD